MTSFTSLRIAASSLAVLIGLSFVSSPLVSAHEVNHENMISGHRPDDMLVAIKNAGYDAEFVSEKGEKPEIEVKFGSDWVTILLEDCDDDGAGRGCDTIILSSTWDRKTAASDTMIAQANLDHRYVSVWRDGEGDPVMQWWIYTGEFGIYRKNLIDSIVIFQGIAANFEENVFKNDEESPPEFEL